MAHSSPSWLTLFALFSLSIIHLSRAFEKTSPLLAWSTAPGASLGELLSDLPQEPDFGPPVSQLSLGSTAPSFCPHGPSSLLVFSLSSPEQKRAFQQGFLAPEISRAYNSVSEPARIWVASRPEPPDGRSLDALVAGWKMTCGGRVVVQELSAGDDIASVFAQNMQNLFGPRLVIFTTTAMPALNGLHKRQLSSALLAQQSSPARIPSSKTGVFWRYSFLSDYLIVGTFVMLLLFIPPVLLGSYALSSIESPRGLKTKMIGQISEVKGT